ncbi:hypothetical protein H632_c538p3 [Helicosporidium sp. ATCC 50920]|nr:hypothetical protein H632_c538p3 [Helicosporidium sp. ATCC 50920]|eukprot:KDD75712.1 hypothetical protein H632_c538p3 [Helicosporidium sp. ATCC 50920]
MRRALEALPEEEAARELRPLPAGAGDQAGEAGAADEVPPRAGILIHQGNTHYEHSILRAAGGGDWREHLDKAVALFEESGAHPEDVCHAVQGHPLAEQVPDMLQRLEQRCQQRRAEKERADSAGQANGAATNPQGGVKPLPPQAKAKA